MRASDACQLSGNVSVHARAGAGVDAGVDAGAGADVDVDVGAGVGACGCEDATGCVRDCDHGDVRSLPSFVIAEAVLVFPEEEDGCASVDAGARANGSGGTDYHVWVHTAVVHAGGAHRDQDAMALAPM
jgi:hypothetical protein